MDSFCLCSDVILRGKLAACCSSMNKTVYFADMKGSTVTDAAVSECADAVTVYSYAAINRCLKV